MTQTDHNPSHRQQQAITIRSDRTVARPQLLAKSGKSQVAIIEEALVRMRLPRVVHEMAARRARLEAIVAPGRDQPRFTMAEFNAEMYDENGLPR